MANTLKFIDMVHKEALSIAHEKASFIGTTDLQYDNSFGQSGAKIGSTLRVRSPNQYTRRTGSRVMDVQDQTEATQNITMATQDGVDMRFNSAELTLDTDSPAEVAAFSKRYIEPAMSVLVSGIESDYIEASTKATYNVVGTAGTAMSTLSYPTLARAKLNQGLAPKDGNRCLQLDSTSMGTLVTGAASYFNPTADLSKQYREGFVNRTAMADFYENERMWSLTNTADVTMNTNAAAGVTDGGTEVNLSEDASVAPSTGAVFTIAGVYACHPETKAAYAHLQQFVIVTGSASAASTVSPATILTGAKKNMSAADGTDLATTDFDEAATVWQGNASTTYVQPLMYHKEAFQFVTADLPLMDDAHKCTRGNMDGIALRVWMASDIRNDELLMRLDILYGMAALRPEWASRIIGA